MTNFKKLILLTLIISSVSLSVQAGPTVAPIATAFAEVQKVIQEQTTKIAEEAKKHLKQQNKDDGDPAANAKPENIEKSKTEVDSKDTRPFVEREATAELEKEKPSVPAIQRIIQKTMLVDNKTLYKAGGVADTESDGQIQDKSLQESQAASTQEHMSSNVHMTLEQARALSQRAIAVEAKRDEELDRIKNDLAKRKTHTEFEKGNAKITQTVNSKLTEILVLRSASLEIDGSQNIQSKQLTVVQP